MSSNVLELSVSDISLTLKRMVEDHFSYVRVRGEISGFRGQHSSGHAYFALKDERSRLDAVIWRGNFNRLKIKPEEGMEVIATGKLSTFPGSSRYQIIIEKLEPAGLGALMMMYEKRKKMLQAEGLFEQHHKKSIPSLPKTIGVITSPTGAVIRDIMHRINERFPTHVLLWPVRVQGDDCAGEVTNAIEGFNRLSADASQNPDQMPRPDLLIVARGGGSIEDLWGFNEENVARATFASDIPIISAVGHETDTTLIDYVSDLRAPTPTAAAEFAVPVKAEMMMQFEEKSHRLKNALHQMMKFKKQNYTILQTRLPKLSEILMPQSQRLDQISMRLTHALQKSTQNKRSQFERLSGRVSVNSIEQKIGFMKQNLDRLDQNMQKGFAQSISDRKSKIAHMEQMLNSLSYKNILKRGYSILLDDEGRAIKNTKAAVKAQNMRIRMADGEIDAYVAGKIKKLDQMNGNSHKGQTKNAKKPASKSNEKAQTSLFDE